VLKFVEDGGLALARHLEHDRERPRSNAVFERQAAFVLQDAAESGKAPATVLDAIASVGIGLLELLTQD
jgi:hypothetical protein